MNRILGERNSKALDQRILVSDGATLLLSVVLDGLNLVVGCVWLARDNIGNFISFQFFFFFFFFYLLLALLPAYPLDLPILSLICPGEWLCSLKLSALLLSVYLGIPQFNLLLFSHSVWHIFF